MRKVLYIIIVCLISFTMLQAGEVDCLLQGLELAQHDDIKPEHPPFPGEGMGPPWRGDMKRFEQLKLIKLLELLDMNEQQETEFIPKFRTHQKQQRQLHRQRNEILENLAKELHDDNADEQKILNLIDKLKDIDNKKLTLHRESISKIENILTPSQLGKLYIFQARFGAEVLGKMKEFNKMRKGMGRKFQLKPDPKDSN